MSVHPQAIDLTALHTRPSGSGRLPVSATLLACLMTTVPTLWLGTMVALALALRY